MAGGLNPEQPSVRGQVSAARVVTDLLLRCASPPLPFASRFWSRPQSCLFSGRVVSRLESAWCTLVGWAECIERSPRPTSQSRWAGGGEAGADPAGQ